MEDLADRSAFHNVTSYKQYPTLDEITVFFFIYLIINTQVSHCNLRHSRLVQLCNMIRIVICSDYNAWFGLVSKCRMHTLCLVFDRAMNSFLAIKFLEPDIGHVGMVLIRICKAIEIKT